MQSGRSDNCFEDGGGRSYDSVVSVAIRLQATQLINQGSAGQGKEIVLFSKASRMGLGPTNHPI
jgi:hypothetical protein